MGNYTSQYENYYKNLRGKSNVRAQNSIDYLAQNGSGRGRSKKKRVRLSYGTLLIFQCIGSLVLLVGFIVVKMLPMEGTKKAYQFGREVLTVNQVDTSVIETFSYEDVYKIKEAVVDYVEDLKSMMTGEDTLKEKIKKEYAAPTKLKSKEVKDNMLILGTDENEEVVASFDGRVKEVKTVDEETYILVDHGNGVETYYGRLKTAMVKENDEVKKGTVIGQAGKFLDKEESGLVFKLIYMGVEKNPVDYMNI